MKSHTSVSEICLQGWAKEWTQGCVNPASWLSLPAWREFTQPRAHYFAQPCNVLLLPPIRGLTQNEIPVFPVFNVIGERSERLLKQIVSYRECE